MSIEYSAHLPEVIPSRVFVFELRGPTNSVQSLALLAAGFGIQASSSEMVELPHSMILSDGSKQVELFNASGALRFRWLSRYLSESDREFDIANPIAVGRARTFIESNPDAFPHTGLVPDHVSHLYSGVYGKESRELEQQIIDAGVVFRREIDRLPPPVAGDQAVDRIRVIGPGGVIMVNVDADLEVVGAQRNWREVSEAQNLGEEYTVSVLRREVALAYLESRLRQYEGDVEVVHADFGYLECGELVQQRYLEPAYLFSFVVRTENLNPDGGLSSKLAFQGLEVIPAGSRTFQLPISTAWTR